MTIETSKIPPKMSESMIKLLCALREAEDRHDTPTLTELSRHLGLSTGAMTQLQDSAVKSGWVTTRHSANDRRHKFLELTREGLALVESMRPEVLEEEKGGLAA